MCHCVKFLVLAGNSFWCYLRTYSTIQLWGCVKFWFQRETVFGVIYILRVQYRCPVVSVFWLWQEIFLQQHRSGCLEVPAKRYIQYQKYQPKYQPLRVPAKFFKNRVPPKSSKLGEDRSQILQHSTANAVFSIAGPIDHYLSLLQQANTYSAIVASTNVHAKKIFKGK